MKKWNNPEVVELNICETANAPRYRQPDGTCGRTIQPTSCPYTNGVGRCNNCTTGGTSNSSSDDSSADNTGTGSSSDDGTDFTS